MRGAAVLAVIVGLLLTGCGGGVGARSPTTPGRAEREAAAEIQQETVPPSAPRRAEQVIRRWADTLRRGDVAGAARLFALPATVQFDPTGPAFRLTRRDQARTFNRLLPCGALLLHSERLGRYAVGVFRLVRRPGARCDGPGHTARTAFLIRGRRIAEWRRLPNPSGGPAA